MVLLLTIIFLLTPQYRCQVFETLHIDCDSMTPARGILARVGRAPFSITPSSRIYRPGDNITVSLSAQSGSFLGFLCQARTDIDSYSSTVGTLVGSHSAKIEEDCAEGSSLTHTELEEKTLVQITWMPSDVHGHVRIVCTFLQDNGYFWVKEKSFAVSYSGYQGGFSFPITSTTPSSAIPLRASTGITISLILQLI